MECNKDEAVRAQTIAEKKFKDKDIAGAKKFALKAQTLYPSLDGISQMLSTFDVHIAAENRVSGEVDWYAVLGLNPTADDDTVRKQYRKLALLLHPDKNKSVGAEGAFKFISEAWSLLSDKGKRLAYNQRRSTIGSQQRVQTQPQRPYSASNSNGVGNFANRAPLQPTTQRNSVPPRTFRRPDAFWTICNHCKMQYEYLRVHIDTPITCPTCHKVFKAVEVVPPVHSSSQQSNLNQRNHVPISNTGRNTAATENIGHGGSAGPNSSMHTNFNWSANPTMAGTVKADPFIAAKASNVYQQAKSTLKREHENSQSSALKGEASSKRRVLHSDFGDKSTFQMHMENSKNSKGNISGLQGFAGFNIRPKSTRELTPLENRKMLTEKALAEIRKKQSEWKLEALNMDAAKKKKVEERREEEMKFATKYCTLSSAQSNGMGKSSTTKRNLSGNSADDEKREVPVLSMNVPDPDFHDFDKDRTEMSFEDNQIWAAYDDDDGMPRFYAFVQKVISHKPFKLRFSWLASKSNSEFGSMEWVSSGFAKSCGELRIVKYEVSKSLNLFSHKVKWTKGARGVIQILPQKGDIWALYRNWASDWNEHTPDEVIHQYDMVEVLDDYNEEKGISVSPLVKVVGFRTVFRPHHSKKMTIPKEEMFRFSHQVPNHVLTGQEGPNAPKGCQELDPAATPIELLQVINEVEVPAVETNGHASKEILLNASGISVI
ncbi:uncharacterized protein LOC141689813 [Apium graveolens]|uniref:uncharacterized protein LOC141689813 n=1 Tax=Apium graveolens TaxID=4045 RepID=UPI003D7B0D06